MPSVKGRSTLGKAFYGIKEDADYPDYTFQFDARKSIIAKCVISGKKIDCVSFLPLYINRHAQPEVISQQDTRFDEVVSYMKKVTENQGLNAKYQVDGDEVIIST